MLVTLTLFLQMGKLIGSLEKQLTEKGEEINGYMEKHQIQVLPAVSFLEQEIQQATLR